MHTYLSRFIPEEVAEASQTLSETPTFYQNYLAVSNTADVTGKLIAVRSQSISDVNTINSLVAFYDIHGRKREVLFFYFVPDTTRDHVMDIYYSLLLLTLPDSAKNCSRWWIDFRGQEITLGHLCQHGYVIMARIDAKSCSSAGLRHRDVTRWPTSHRMLAFSLYF
jgi:hypothetical protein